MGEGGEEKGGGWEGGGGSEEGMVSRVSAPRPPLCQVTSLLDLVSSANHLFSDGLQGKGKICMIHPHQISITPHHIKDQIRS